MFRLLYLIVFILSSAALASAEDITRITGFHVTQETSRQNGVLVSRPKPLHQDIVNLLARNKIQSLEDYTGWLKTNIRYENDGRTDIWSPPQETLRAKVGDCEDYALLNATVMEVLGYQPHFLALVKKGHRAHAICTIKHNGYLLWFDNAKLIKTQLTSLDQFAKDISTQYDYTALLEFDLKTKKWDVLYDKVNSYAVRPSVSPQVTLSSR